MVEHETRFSDNIHNTPMSIGNIIIIISIFIFSLVGLVFTANIYRIVWLASAPEIDFSSGIIVFLPLSALFLFLTFEIYFRNIKKQETPAWIFGACKYTLYAMVLALIAAPTVIAPAVKYHLTAAGYSKVQDKQPRPGRGLWQKWKKIEDAVIHTH